MRPIYQAAFVCTFALSFGCGQNGVQYTDQNKYEYFDKILTDNQMLLKVCFDNYIRETPQHLLKSVYARVRMRFNDEGTATSIVFKTISTDNNNLEDCIAGVLLDLKMPRNTNVKFNLAVEKELTFLYDPNMKPKPGI